jgi:hypothetical protein
LIKNFIDADAEFLSVPAEEVLEAAQPLLSSRGGFSLEECGGYSEGVLGLVRRG